jgi:hypothetical protein
MINSPLGGAAVGMFLATGAWLGSDLALAAGWSAISAVAGFVAMQSIPFIAAAALLAVPAFAGVGYWLMKKFVKNSIGAVISAVSPSLYRYLKNSEKKLWTAVDTVAYSIYQKQSVKPMYNPMYWVGQAAAGYMMYRNYTGAISGTLDAITKDDSAAYRIKLNIKSLWDPAKHFGELIEYDKADVADESQASAPAGAQHA